MAKPRKNAQEICDYDEVIAETEYICSACKKSILPGRNMRRIKMKTAKFNGQLFNVRVVDYYHLPLCPRDIESIKNSAKQIRQKR